MHLDVTAESFRDHEGDDATMADEMMRTEFLAYMQAFEQRLDTRFTKIDEQFKNVDEQFMNVDKRLENVDKRLENVDKRFGSVDKQLQNNEKQFTSINERFDSLEQTMKVQFEETRGLIRLSLEAVGGLRETTERGFSDVRAEVGEQTSLLKDVARHVRVRVERVERRRK